MIKIVFFLSSCSSDADKDQSLLSSLIAPNFSYKQDYFNCNLNKGNSLINIESFFSKIVDKYSEKKLEDLSLFLLFPDKNEIINSFTISIISQKNYETVLLPMKHPRHLKFHLQNNPLSLKLTLALNVFHQVLICTARDHTIVLAREQD